MKLESKLTFLLAVVTLLICGVLILTKHLGLASRLINLVFWMILISVVLYIWEIKKGR